MSVRPITTITCYRVYNKNMRVRSNVGIPIDKINDENIIAHFSDGITMNFTNGETIINGMEEPNGVYLIQEGFVKAFSVSEEGHGNLLLIHQTGDFIPLPWALDGAHTTGLYYQAIQNVTVIRTSKYRLRTALGTNAWLSQEIMKQTINILTTYTQRIQTLEFRSARGRLISELLNLSERFGEKHGKQILINAPITHQDLSDSINMNRETASRALEKLFKEGLLGQVNHLFTILDLPKLQDTLK